MTTVEPPKNESTRDPNPDSRRWLQALFDRYQRPLLAYAWRWIGDVELAQDCVQETFLALCRQSQASVEGHVEAWLFKTCRHRAMDHHRRESRMPTTSFAPFDEPRVDSSNDPSMSLQDKEDHQRLAAEIKRLPLREQELLMLRLSDGLSYKQIAEITGLSTSNVGFLLHTALTRLRAAIVSTNHPSND